MTPVSGFSVAQKVFDLPYKLELHTVADVTEDAAARAAADFGFAHSTGDWRSMMSNAEIDLIDITAPSALRKEMALAAIAAGRHVYCEKPLAPLVSDAREMTEAAARASMKTQVGFNYLCNPMLRLSRDIATRQSLSIRSRHWHCRREAVCQSRENCMTVDVLIEQIPEQSRPACIAGLWTKRA